MGSPHEVNAEREAEAETETETGIEFNDEWHRETPNESEKMKKNGCNDLLSVCKLAATKWKRKE